MILWRSFKRQLLTRNSSSTYESSVTASLDSYNWWAKRKWWRLRKWWKLTRKLTGKLTLRKVRRRRREDGDSQGSNCCESDLHVWARLE
jgi:hypothetical protein